MMNLVEIRPNDWQVLLQELDKRLRISEWHKLDYQIEASNSDFKAPNQQLYNAIICNENAASFYSGMTFAIDMLVSHNFEKDLRIEPDDNGKHHLVCFGNYE